MNPLNWTGPEFLTLYVPLLVVSFFVAKALRRPPRPVDPGGKRHRQAHRDHYDEQQEGDHDDERGEPGGHTVFLDPPGKRREHQADTDTEEDRRENDLAIIERDHGGDQREHDLGNPRADGDDGLEI